jgi:hypothetical protein
MGMIESGSGGWVGNCECLKLKEEKRWTYIWWTGERLVDHDELGRPFALGVFCGHLDEVFLLSGGSNGGCGWCARALAEEFGQHDYRCSTQEKLESSLMVVYTNVIPRELRIIEGKHNRSGRTREVGENDNLFMECMCQDKTK